MFNLTTSLRLFYLASLLILAGCGESVRDQKPTIKLGAETAIKEGRSAVASAQVTDDKGGYQISWKQLSGPKLQLSNSTSPNLTVTAPELSADAVAMLQISVTDSAGHIVTADLKVTLHNNQLPTIKAAFSVLNEKSQTELQLEVADPDGQIQAVKWTQLSGPQLTFSQNQGVSVQVQTPAISKVETAIVRLEASDDDGETLVLDKSIRLEPLWQEVDVTGMLAAKEMAGAQVLAAVNGESFSTYASADARFQLKLKIDDDANNDMVLLRAISPTKTGMELWLTVPAVLAQHNREAYNLTPHSTAILALSVRANKGILPGNKADLSRLETMLYGSEVAEAAVLIAAYAEQHKLSLPSGIVNTVIDQPSYQSYRQHMTEHEAELLAQLHMSLPQQGFSAVDLTSKDMLSGLRLLWQEDAGSALMPDGFYVLEPTMNGQMADPQASYPVRWSVLAGAMQLVADTSKLPLYQTRVDNPDLALSAEQVAALRAGGIEQLYVRITGSWERFVKLSHGAGLHLFLQIKNVQYQPEPLVLHGQNLKFPAVDIQTESYVWGSVLYPDTVSATEQELSGTWLLPLFEAGTELGAALFKQQELVLQPSGRGFIRHTNTSFHWSSFVDPAEGPIVRFSFSNHSSLDIRLLKKTNEGFQVDLFAKDHQGKWLAAQKASFIRRVE
ncbi:hypothetical protein [Rheinheimera sp.]|uniref:hypothetical protein n=1 Tax=Rheinheimera sp. TaxID=1869214 RepID=UPI0027B9DA94|nr:hypothetical protein [Rheinheimera sp.]